jgi:hypothetical protein
VCLEVLAALVLVVTSLAAFLTMARYRKYGCRSASGGPPTEVDVKSVLREHGYTYAAVFEELGDRRAWVPLLETREPHSFTLGVPLGGRGGTRGAGEEEIVTFEGESDHTVLVKYMGIFEHAVKKLEQSNESMNYRTFMSCTSDGIANLEAYLNHRVASYVGQRFKYSN